MATRSEPHGRISAGWAHHDAPGPGTGCPDQSRAGPVRATPGIPGRPQFLPACALHEQPCPPSLGGDRRGHHTVAGSGSAAQRAGAAGQGRLHARVCAVPRRSFPVDAAADAALSGRSLPLDCDYVSPSGRHRHTPALGVRPLPAAPRPQRTDASLLANGTTVRRTSSDPGRALLTGFVNCRSQPTTGRSSIIPGCAGSARPRRTSTTTARRRWKMSWPTTSRFTNA